MNIKEQIRISKITISSKQLHITYFGASKPDIRKTITFNQPYDNDEIVKLVSDLGFQLLDILWDELEKGLSVEAEIDWEDVSE